MSIKIKSQYEQLLGYVKQDTQNIGTPCHTIEVLNVTDLHIEIGDYKTIKPIPYSILEETLKNLISNWNQKQKEK